MKTKFSNFKVRAVRPTQFILASSTTKMQGAFSLIEMLMVMMIMTVVSVFLAPAIGSLGASGSFSSNTSALSEAMDAARAYAVSKSTYVYLGIDEFQASAPDSVGNVGNGRVAMFAVASKDGTRITAKTDFPQKAQPIGRLVRLQNTTVVDAMNETAGGLQRPTGGTVKALSGSAPILTFPLSGTAQYSFNQCIEFSPQGMAMDFNSSDLPGFIEIAMMPTKGNTVVASKNVAVVQVSGLTGKPTMYRP